jgi:hypothetical protein
MNPVENLSVTESAGRRLPRVIKNERTEEVVVYDMPSRECPGCREVTREGAAITKLFMTWWHHDCAVKYLTGAGRDEAWRVLGEQLAARPGDFNRAQTRAIVSNLMRMLAGGAS